MSIEARPFTPAVAGATQPDDTEAHKAHSGGGHAVTRDQADWAKARPGAIDYLRHAQARSGRRPMELAREFLRLTRGRGRLTWPEYVQYGVYDTDRLSPAAQAEFITNTLHWPITHACCDMTWQATTEDKWLCARILAGTSVKMPRTLAVIDKSARSYPDTEKLSTTAALRDFFTTPGILPVFGKENRGICSFGAFLATDADGQAVHLKGHGPIDYKTFLERFVGETPYLLQESETNHPFFAPVTDALATIRLCVLAKDGAIGIPFAVLKLPARDNIADSFWRPGNLACALDPETGDILTVRSKDAFGTTDHPAHPETGTPLLGRTVPEWPRVLELARACAPVFAPLRYQSMDIAVTGNGPVLIEINTGGGFDLPQLASGRGFLTEAVADFFRASGYGKV
ncbi:MAG: sugar-transfer associated ATP-grasp domain-containing protein [Alphaproteobacteria bacterium]